MFHFSDIKIFLVSLKGYTQQMLVTTSPIFYNQQFSFLLKFNIPTISFGASYLPVTTSAGWSV